VTWRKVFCCNTCFHKSNYCAAAYLKLLNAYDLLLLTNYWMHTIYHLIILQLTYSYLLLETCYYCRKFTPAYGPIDIEIMNLNIIVKKIQRQQIVDSPINTYMHINKDVETCINTYIHTEIHICVCMCIYTNLYLYL
jgi:hypothetical protein